MADLKKLAKASTVLAIGTGITAGLVYITRQIKDIKAAEAALADEEGIDLDEFDSDFDAEYIEEEMPEVVVIDEEPAEEVPADTEGEEIPAEDTVEETVEDEVPVEEAAAEEEADEEIDIEAAVDELLKDL